MNKNIKFYIKIAGVLFLVCAITALVLSAVNSVTKARIEANQAQKMSESISSIFDGNITIDEIKFNYEKPVSCVYKVLSDNKLIGYGVHVVPMGFKGDIEMIVGVELDGSCRSVRILSMSETPGLGTRVGETAFLEQFDAGSDTFVVKENITPVAGATISSKAITLGVNSAIEALKTGGILS